MSVAKSRYFTKMSLTSGSMYGTIMVRMVVVVTLFQSKLHTFSPLATSKLFNIFS